MTRRIAIMGGRRTGKAVALAAAVAEARVPVVQVARVARSYRFRDGRTVLVYADRTVSLRTAAGMAIGTTQERRRHSAALALWVARRAGHYVRRKSFP